MSRGLKFLDLLTEQNFKALEKAFAPNAERRSQMLANNVIKGIVNQGAKLLQSPRKPGPKREDTTNGTDEELRRLIENVRSVMGTTGKISRLDTVRLLSRFIRNASNVCTDFCFLTRSEYQSLRRDYHQLSAAADPEDEEVNSALRPFFEEGSIMVEEVRQFEELTEDSVLVNELPSQDASSSELEANAFTGLAFTLELAVFDSKATSYKDYGLSRAAILRAGLARLTHLKQLLKGVHLALDGHLLQTLHHHVRGAYLRDLKNKEVYERIEGLLYKATRRQAIHPLHRFTLENLDFNARTFGEGDIYPGGHYDGRLREGRSNREKVGETSEPPSQEREGAAGG